jgi:guanylate kinase
LNYNLSSKISSNYWLTEIYSPEIAKAHVELATAPQFDVVIKNYDLELALDEANNLVKDFIDTNSTN